MAAVAQFSGTTGGNLATTLFINSAVEGKGLPSSPGTPRSISWDSMGMGPAPPTTCVLVHQDAVTPPSPSTPKDLITSTLSAGSRRLPVQTSAEIMSCKRKIDFAVRAAIPTVRHHGVQKRQTASVVRRNERERNRVRLVNNGFTTLRQHVPAGRDNRKMSKVDTLRAAVDYIKQLQELLNDNDAQVNLAFDTLAMHGGETTTLQHLAAACDMQQQILPHQQLSPSGSMGESDHTASQSGYSSSAEESHSTGTEPMSPEEPSLVDLTSWLQ